MSAITRRVPAGVVSTFVALLIWQLAAMVGPLSSGSFPTVIATVGAFFIILTEPILWTQLLATAQMAVVGFFISVVLAVPVGICLGLSRFAYRSTKFTFDFFKVIPPIVIIPITILVLGPTIQMGIFLVVFANFFALAIQTAYGVRDTDVVLLETMRCYRLGTGRQILFARLPAAAPFVAIGLRIAASVALIVAVVAGLVGGAPGLGQLLAMYQTGNQTAKTFAVVLLLGILGILVSRGIVVAQRHLVFWMGK